jgi:zinc/manganese transport system substrate-binding protein
MLTRRTLLILAAGAPGAARAATPLTVVTSFSILADLVREVAGARVRVISLVGPDQDLHAYQPKPSDLRTLAGADLLVLNGLGVEGWSARMAQASGFKGRVVVASRGVAPLHPATGGAAGADASEGQFDPHAWQDVGNVKLYVANIRDGLAAADPAGAAGYRAAAAAYLAKLDRLDADIRAAYAPIPRGRRWVITTHDALAYYGRAYGLSFRAPLGLSTESEPSAKDIAALERQIRAEHITALFFENISNDALLRQIAKDTGVRVGGVLYSDALSPPDGPAGTYIAMMRHNLAEIVQALK